MVGHDPREVERPEPGPWYTWDGPYIGLFNLFWVGQPFGRVPVFHEGTGYRDFVGVFFPHVWRRTSQQHFRTAAGLRRKTCRRRRGMISF